MRRTLLSLVIVATVLPALAANGIAHADQRIRAGTAPADAVTTWNTIAVNATVTAGTFQTEGLIHTAYVQAAVYDAVVAIDGGYRPYVGHLRGPRWASVDAAVAAAAHAVLLHRYPAQQAALDTTYQTYLAGLPAGGATAAGTAVGEQAAADVLAARADDGLNAPIGYTFGSGPGAWILPTDNTAPAFQTPQTPWVAQMRPFLIASAAEFRPGPPPALTTARYARDLSETEAYGSKTSTVRTPEQTQTALFWTTNAVVADNAAVRGLAGRKGWDAVQTARALAMGDMVESDSLIACWDAKYHYSFWRPYTAIRGADTDGNPATTSDPVWLPLAPTPNHPEYPAAHACGTGALAEVFAALLQTRRIGVDVSSTVTGTTRHYASTTAMDREVVNARVWAGLHYRNSGDVGIALAKRVARDALEHHFQPVS